MKSKRSRSPSCSKDDETHSSIAKHAKLTPASTKTDNQSQQNNVVHHISNFLSSKNNQSIQFLLTYLESTEEVELPSYSDNVSITQQDVATLLLPWSIAHLMRSNTTDEKNVWRTLSICLNLLIDCTEPSIETTLCNCLSQSTLVRLVHKAASSTFVGGDTKNQEYASNCFVKLMKRYHPSFEIGCNTLLKDVEDFVYANLDEGDRDSYCKEVALPRHQYRVVCGALRLIHTLLNGANVKRSFSMLSSVEMLPRLGRMGFVKCTSNGPYDVGTSLATNDDHEDAKSAVENIIMDGLFHSTHHVDGFRTMDELRSLPKLPEDGEDGRMNNGSNNDTRKSGGKGCYQAGLFLSLRMILSDASKVDNEKPTKSRDVAATINLLPILVHGFFESIQCKQSSGIKRSTEADAKLQFYFWAHATISAFGRILNIDGLDLNSDLVLLKMASETLHMILDRDVYSPSYSDPDEALLSFLKFVTQGILGHSHVQEYNSTSPAVKEKISSYVLTSMRTLMLLNHRLVFEQLPTCISFACYNLHQYRNENASSEAVAFLFTIVKTFSELRQIGYFLSSTRTAFSCMEVSAGNLELLQCRKITAQLATSYQTLPSGQLKEIWVFFDEWIAGISRNRLSSSTSNELGLASKMFILYIKSIRTDKHNSSELRTLCENSMTLCVSELLDSDRSGIDILKAGTPMLRIYMNICGWLVDIHTRSCFWLESIDTGSAFLLTQTSKDDQTPTVLSYLHDVVGSTVESEHFKQEQSTFNYQVEYSQSYSDTSFKAFSAALVRLALHRIHQLHSMIYYCKVQEHEDKDRNDNISSTKLVYEAKLLVNFVIYTSRTFRNSSDVGFESESLWSSIASSLGTWSHYSEPHHMKVFLNWFFSVLYQIEDKASQQDKDCVLTLTRDASFYEVRECMTMIMQEGITFALGKVTELLPISRHIIESSSDRAASSCLNIASQIVKSSDSLNERAVQGVNMILSFLSSVPSDLIFCEENTKLVDKAVAIDVLVCKMYEIAMTSSKNMVNTLTKTICAARYLLIVLVPKATLFLHKGDASLVTTTAAHIITSSLLFNDSRILWPSGNVMCELLMTSIDNYDISSSLMSELLLLMEEVVKGVNNATSTIEFATRAYLIRSLIRRIITLHRRHSFPTKALHSCIKMALLCRNHIWGKIIQHINISSVATSISLLLASDVLAFLGNDELAHSNPGLITHDIVDRSMKDAKEIFYIIAQNQNSNLTSTPDNDAAMKYFLSSLATVEGVVSNISTETYVNTLLSAILREEESFVDQSVSGLECHLLESALCSLLRKSTISDIQYIVSFLLPNDKAERPSYSFTARIYYLLIHCVKSQEHMQILSNQSIPLFLTSMNLLTEEQGRNSYERFASNIELFSTLMSSIIPRKDLLLLSGREITMICCGMSSIFRHKQTDDADAVPIFKSCCSVVSSLISNYPKQLYGCPNGLFSLLLAMLDCILRSNSKRSNAMALEYAK
eukprot:scaffold3107_cov70-Cyclotella_meneghiniana.AAC.2